MANKTTERQNIFSILVKYYCVSSKELRNIHPKLTYICKEILFHCVAQIKICKFGSAVSTYEEIKAMKNFICHKMKYYHLPYDETTSILSANI